MSSREQAKQIIDSIPENEMLYVIEFLNQYKKSPVVEVEPDEWDLEMIEEAKRENDGTTISFDDLMAKVGLTYADIQD